MSRKNVKTPQFRGLVSSSAAASRSKRSNRAKGTAPEIILGKAFYALGLRYRLHANLPGRPDFIFPKARVAVFVDGDFWHGKDWAARRRKLVKGSNSTYWVAKILANRKRDRINNRQLKKNGWFVLRYWESHVKTGSAEIAIEVAQVIGKRVSG